MFRKRKVPRVKLNAPAWIEVGNMVLLERCSHETSASKKRCVLN